MGFTDEELESLSEEERAALEEGEKNAGDEGDDNEDVDDSKAGDGGEDDDDRKEGQEGAQDADGDDEGTQPDARTDQDGRAAVTPPFQLDAGEKGKTLDEINAELEKLDEQFEEGDISLKDYNAQRDALNQARFRLEMYEDINRQVAAQAVEIRWKQAQEDFFSEHPEYRSNAVLNAAYVHVVNGLLATEEGKKMSDRAILMKAFETVNESLGIGGEKSKETTDSGKAALKAAKDKEAQKGRDGMSLRDMPKAQEADMSDRFDVLDKLEGEDFELAIARLSDAERKAYARRG